VRLIVGEMKNGAADHHVSGGIGMRTANATLEVRSLSVAPSG
jgi:hypothetical protein